MAGAVTIDEYPKAQKKGQRCYQKYLLEGRYPYLPVLDELLTHVDVISEEKLGVVQIPADLIVGTYAVGRRTAFAPNFMPLLDRNTEFGAKWAALAEAHLTEGIRDPIKCYEFMNRYYVVEGNKRVSVLKFYGAVAVVGNVTRLIPKRTNEPENRLYFEYLDFYRKSLVNYIIFSKNGSYREFLEKLKMAPDHVWTDEDRMNVRSVYVRFSQAYRERGGEKPPIPTADAFLVWLEYYPLEESMEKLPASMKTDLAKIWEEIVMRGKEQPAEIKTEPAQAPKKNLLDILIPSAEASRKLKIAFIHQMNEETSAWTYGHELGRKHIEQMGQDIETVVYKDVTTDTLEKVMLDAIAAKCDIIFTTTPRFLETSAKVAIDHPQVKILNCSVDTSHHSVRTYYARLYEAKFLSGIVAGAMSPDGRIGYMADYPINGMIANINAFAIGAKMVNPRAKVYLEWTAVKSREEITQGFMDQGIRCVSYQEMIIPNSSSRLFGLVWLEEGKEPEKLCMTTWHWGALYERVVQVIRSGAWAQEESGGISLNYWWGMSADVIEFICSQKVPEKTRQLVDYLKVKISERDLHPFGGILRSQEGVICADERGQLSPQEVISMNWLADNVIGSIPEYGSLRSEAKALVEVQGVEKSEPSADEKLAAREKEKPAGEEAEAASGKEEEKPAGYTEAEAGRESLNEAKGNTQ